MTIAVVTIKTTTTSVTGIPTASAMDPELPPLACEPVSSLCPSSCVGVGTVAVEVGACCWLVSVPGTPLEEVGLGVSLANCEVVSGGWVAVVPAGCDGERGGRVAVVPAGWDGEPGGWVAVVAGRGLDVPGWDNWAELEREIEVITISGSCGEDSPG